MVAKKYANWEQISEPYMYDGKIYVKVKGVCPACKGVGMYDVNKKGIRGHICITCRGTGWEVKPTRWFKEKTKE